MSRDEGERPFGGPLPPPNRTHINLAVVSDNAVDAFLDGVVVSDVDAVERGGEAKVVVKFLHGSCGSAARSLSAVAQNATPIARGPVTHPLRSLGELYEDLGQ